MYYKQHTGLFGISKSINAQNWVKWTHHSKGKTHCDVCLMLNGCWFLKGNLPSWPHHSHCHCTLEPISYAVVFTNVTAHSDYSKFDPYLFNTNGNYTHTKEKLFAQWGYTVKEARWLKAEIEQQALEKYLSGEYVLGKLNGQGQRVSTNYDSTTKHRGNCLIHNWMDGTA